MPLQRIISGLAVALAIMALTCTAPAQRAAIDSLKRLAATAADDSVRMRAYYSLSDRLQYSDVDSALACARKGLAIAERRGSRWWIAGGLRLAGLALLEQGSPSRAMEAFRRSKAVYEEFGNTDRIATVRQNIGKTFWRQGIYDSAITHLSAACRTFRELDDEEALAGALMGLGAVYYESGDLPKAFELTHRSWKIYDTLGDRFNVAQCLVNMANIYSLQQKLGKAQEHLIRALKICEDLGERGIAAKCLGNLGYINLHAGKYERAKRYNERSLAIFRDLGITPSIAICLNVLGNILVRQDSLRRGVEYLEEALALEEEIGRTHGLAVGHCDIGGHYYRIAEYEKSERHLRRALEIAERIGAVHNIGCALQQLHQTLFALGKTREAYRVQARWNALQDSITAAENRQEFNDLQAKYETDRRDHKIILLEKDNALQKMEVERQQAVVARQRLEAQDREQRLTLLQNRQEIQQLRIARTEEELQRQKAESQAQKSELERARTDQELKATLLAREKLIRNVSISGVVLVLIIAALLFKRYRDRRTASDLRAEAAEARAEAADAAALRMRAEHERRSREAQERFSRRLIGAQEEERQRIAGELHDSLAQKLIVIQNRTQLALRKNRENPDYLASQIEDISGTAVEALAEVRGISHELRPPLLERFGLGGTVEEMIAELDEATSVKWTAEVDIPEGSVDPDSQISAYRIIQESVTNILRHADASHASIRLTENDGRIDIRIEDDGNGFDTETAQQSDGLGMKSMQERARLLGGELTVQSEPGLGTRVHLVLPVRQNTPESSVIQQPGTKENA